MNPLLGASIFPTGTETDFIADLSTVITDNLPVVLAIFAFYVGIRLALRWFSSTARGKGLKV